MRQYLNVQNKKIGNGVIDWVGFSKRAKRQNRRANQLKPAACFHNVSTIFAEVLYNCFNYEANRNI
jgi:hypothetical protein